MPKRKQRRPVYVQTQREARPRTCPGCRRVNDAATHANLERPGAPARLELGDVGVCAYCSAVLVVTADGFRLATERDVAALDPDLQRLVREYVPLPFDFHRRRSSS